MRMTMSLPKHAPMSKAVKMLISRSSHVDTSYAQFWAKYEKTPEEWLAELGIQAHGTTDLDRLMLDEGVSGALADLSDWLAKHKAVIAEINSKDTYDHSLGCKDAVYNMRVRMAADTLKTVMETAWRNL